MSPKVIACALSPTDFDQAVLHDVLRASVSVIAARSRPTRLIIADREIQSAIGGGSARCPASAASPTGRARARRGVLWPSGQPTDAPYPARHNTARSHRSVMAALGFNAARPDQQFSRCASSPAPASA